MVGMESSRVPVEIDAELLARAEQAGAPTGRSATAVVEDAVRAYLGADVIDTVRERNRHVDSDEIAELARAELKALRQERQHAAQ
jgi:Arc/MetJ family transcription regulator